MLGSFTFLLATDHAALVGQESFHRLDQRHIDRSPLAHPSSHHDRASLEGAALSREALNNAAVALRSSLEAPELLSVTRAALRAAEQKAADEAAARASAEQARASAEQQLEQLRSEMAAMKAGGGSSPAAKPGTGEQHGSRQGRGSRRGAGGR